MAKVISFYSQKGGTGKTTAASNIAVVLSQNYNKRVLLIETDLQGNLTKNFALDKSITNSLLSILLNQYEKGNQGIGDAIYKTEYDNLSVIPCSNNNFYEEEKLNIYSFHNTYNTLKDKINKINHKFDYIIIDCPPSLGAFTVSALIASTNIIAPFKIDLYNSNGLSSLIKKVLQIKREYNKKIEKIDIFVNIYEKTNVNIQGRSALIENLKDINLSNIYEDIKINLFETLVRKSTKVVEATFFKPVVVYDKKNNTSLDYFSLTKEILEGMVDNTN